MKLARFSDLKEQKIVTNRMTLSRWQKLSEDPFPAPLQLGKNTVAWRVSEVEAWVDRRERHSEEDLS